MKKIERITSEASIRKKLPSSIKLYIKQRWCNYVSLFSPMFLFIHSEMTPCPIASEKTTMLYMPTMAITNHLNLPGWGTNKCFTFKCDVKIVTLKSLTLLTHI